MSFKLYSHRGNLYGPNPERENKLDYINEAVSLGFNVEIDIWLTEDNNIMLGHDNPETLVTFEYLMSFHDSLLLHAKNIAALMYFSSRTRFNVFYHTDEHAVISSNGNIIIHPNSYSSIIPSKDVIYSMPELSKVKLTSRKSVITDYAGDLYEYYTNQYFDFNKIPEILRY